jgi:hypothetical protein
MNLGKRVRSNIDYGRELVRSGFEGAAHDREAFLDGVPLLPFLNDAARRARKQAAIGVCLGLLGGYLGRRHKPANRAVAYGALGGIIGFGAGFTWRAHRLAASIGHGAATKVNAVRDEHWLERHPINYA